MKGDGDALRVEMNLSGLGAAMLRQAARELGMDVQSAACLLIGMGCGALAAGALRPEAQREPATDGRRP